MIFFLSYRGNQECIQYYVQINLWWNKGSAFAKLKGIT